MGQLLRFSRNISNLIDLHLLMFTSFFLLRSKIVGIILTINILHIFSQDIFVDAVNAQGDCLRDKIHDRETATQL